jgi:glycosyltransferase involved in cell wall biosynthesis
MGDVGAVSRPGPCRQRHRILFVIESLGAAGAEYALLTLGRELHGRGHAVHVAVLAPPYDLCADFESAGLVVHRLERGRARGAAELARLTRALDATVVHAHLFWAGALTALSGSLARGPARIATFHNLGYSSYPPVTLRRKLRRAGDRFAMRHGMDGWVAVSSAVARHYGEHLGLTPIRVIPNPLDLPALDRHAHTDPAGVRRRHGLPQDRPVIVCAATLRPEKGHSVLLAALARLRAQGLKAVTVLAGHGPLRAPIEQQIAALGLGPEVRLLGRVPRDALLDLLGAADLAVLSSLHEGLSMSAAESIALGTPVVASKTGGLEDIVEEGSTGLLVRPGDPDALATALARALIDAPWEQVLSPSVLAPLRDRLASPAVAQAHESLYTALARRRELATARA